MMYFPYPPSYNPHHPRQAAPDPDPGEVPQHVFSAAILAGASHLSADGRMAYCQRFNLWFEAEYDNGVFGAWWVIEALPAGAVKLE